MKMKVLAMVLSLMLIISVTVFSTIAYLVDEKSVTNKFTVGNVDIKVDEEKVDENGNPVDEDGNPLDPGEDPVRTEDGNTYHLVPGKEYTKDPTMTINKGSEPTYVRMLVTLTHFSQIKSVFGDDFLAENCTTTWDAAIWPCENTSVDTTEDTITYEFRYAGNLTAEKAEENIVLPPLFESFFVPNEVDGDDLKALADVEIKVTGHAIQRSGFNNEQEAWVAFDDQIEAENGN